MRQKDERGTQKIQENTKEQETRKSINQRSQIIKDKIETSIQNYKKTTPESIENPPTSAESEAKSKPKSEKNCIGRFKVTLEAQMVGFSRWVVNLESKAGPPNRKKTMKKRNRKIVFFLSLLGSEKCYKNFPKSYTNGA